MPLTRIRDGWARAALLVLAISSAAVLAAFLNGDSRRSMALTLVAAIGSAGALTRAGSAGGRINHPETHQAADREGGPARPH